MPKKIKAFVGQVPQKFSQKTRIPKIPLIIMALIVGSIGTYAIVHSFATTGSIIFQDDFESGTFDPSKWYVQALPGRATVLSGGAFQGNNYAHFEVDQGDVEPNTGSSRAEISGPTFNEGQDLYIRDAIRIPSGVTYSGGWQIIHQLHEVNWGGSPGIAIFLNPQHVLQIGAGDGSPTYWQSTALQTNRWYDIVYHVNLSEDPSVGFMEVWLNGVPQQLLNGQTRMYGQTIQTSQDYLKVGIYRDKTSTGTSLIDHDNIIVGTSYDAVTGTTAPPPPPPADTTAPTVALTAPAKGATVSGQVPLAATASDNTAVSKVEFYADGNLISTDTSSPYTATWNASSAVAGAHTITAKAYDAAGNVGTTSNAVTVSAPAISQLITSQGFESGTLNGWNISGVGDAVPTVVSDIVRNGTKSARFVLTGNQGRSELILGGDGSASTAGTYEFKEGDDYYYAFSIYIKSMIYGQPGGHNIIFQLKGNDQQSPDLALQLWNYLGAASDGSPGGKGLWYSGDALGSDRFISPISEQQWHDIVVHFKVSNQGAGSDQIYLDGKLIRSDANTNTMQSDTTSTYIKNGLYRNGTTVVGTSDIRIDDAKLGTTYSAVAEPSSPADTTAPTVSITAPTSGATASGTVNLTAAANDNVGVAGVQFKLDGNNLGSEDTVAPFTSSWDTTKTTNGTHTLTAVAHDAAGNSTTSSPVTITVSNIDTTPPTVSFASPASGSTVSGIVTTTANATDNIGVSKVDLSLDGVLKMTDTSSPYNYSFDSKTLTNGSHTLTAKAYDAAGNSSTTTITVNVNNPDTTPPNAPTGLSATAASATTVNLHWNAATDTGTNPTGVVKYDVLRNGVVIAQPTTTSYTDASATANTSYSYTVQAVDAAGNVSSNSNTVAVTTPAAPDTIAPTVPTNLAATAISASQVNVAWGASTDTGGSGLAGYNVYRNGTKLNSTPVTGTSYGDSTVNASTTYSYTVQAVDGAGNKSIQTSPVSVTTPPTPDTIAPSIPTNLQAHAASASQVNVAWGASTDTGGSGLAGYNVYRNGTKLNTTLITNVLYDDTSVSARTTYSYTVQAVDAVGNKSAQSGAVSVTTPRAARTQHGGGKKGSSLSQTSTSTTPTTTTTTTTQSAINVKVSGAGHKPVNGASVVVSDQTATTDSSGIAHFSNVATGKQTVSVDYNGKETSKVIDVKSAAVQSASEPELFNVATVRNIDPVLLAIPVIVLLAAGGFFMRPWEKFVRSPIDNSVADSVITSNHPTEETTSQPGRKLETPGAVYSPKEPKNDKSGHD